MIEVKNINKHVCFNCKRTFDVGVEIDFDKKFFNTHKLCKSCAKSLYVGLGKTFVPKAIKNKSCTFKIFEK